MGKGEPTGVKKSDADTAEVTERSASFFDSLPAEIRAAFEVKQPTAAETTDEVADIPSPDPLPDPVVSEELSPDLAGINGDATGEALPSADTEVKAWTIDKLSEIIPKGTIVRVSEDGKIGWPSDITDKLAGMIIEPVIYHNLPKFSYDAKVGQLIAGVGEDTGNFYAEVEILPDHGVPAGFTRGDFGVLSPAIHPDNLGKLDEAIRPGQEVVARDVAGDLYYLRNPHEADGLVVYDVEDLADDEIQGTRSRSQIEDSIIDWYSRPEAENSEDFERIPGGLRISEDGIKIGILKPDPKKTDPWQFPLVDGRGKEVWTEMYINEVLVPPGELTPETRIIVRFVTKKNKPFAQSNTIEAWREALRQGKEEEQGTQNG